MPVLPDSTECVALRADTEGNRLNSQFQRLIKINQLKLMEGKSVIAQDRSRYLDKH